MVGSALEQQLSDFFDSVGPALFYLAVWSLVFAGTGLLIGAFIPFITGDSLLFAAGLITAAHPDLNIVVLATGVGIAAFVGDQVGFIMARHYGRPYLDRRASPRMQRAITKVEHFYEKYGWWSVVVARFIPWGRVFIPWVAGIGHMQYYRFLTSNLVGALAWGVGLTLTGYYAASIPAVKSAAYGIGFFFIGASIIFSFRTWWLDRQERLSLPA